MAVVATAADNNYTSRQHYFAMTATSASDSTPLQVLMPSTSTLAPVLRMDKDALLLIIQRLESFDDLARLAASCHFFHNLLFATDDCCTRKYTTAKEKSEIFQGVARRRWPEADVDLFYGGNWQRMCSDDNAADSASCTIVEVRSCVLCPLNNTAGYGPALSFHRQYRDGRSIYDN